MSQDTTRRLLREFGVAVTSFEDAVEGGQGEAARTAEGITALTFLELHHRCPFFQ